MPARPDHGPERGPFRSRLAIAPPGPGPYMGPTIHTNDSTILENKPMRAEHEKLVGDIKESLALLRRSL